MKIVHITGITALAALGSILAGGMAQANVPSPHPQSVNQRLRNQQTRIDQGIHSGELTRHETRSLDRRDDKVLRQEQRDRFFHHGHLTSSERRHLSSELNRDSRAIYRDKHNGQVR